MELNLALLHAFKRYVEWSEEEIAIGTITRASAEMNAANMFGTVMPHIDNAFRFTEEFVHTEEEQKSYIMVKEFIAILKVNKNGVHHYNVFNAEECTCSAHAYLRDHKKN